ncbi:MAG: NUDIX domain-containing protein [Syntrophobacteraceae bacterium]|jgi:ADP-ribose pyrophosphatase
MEEKIKTLGTLNANHFSADLDLVRLRTGKTTERIKIRHPEAAAVIPFLDENHIVMVRQWRYAIQRETLEAPAGKADAGEDLAVCAHRELYEETGRRAARLIHLFEYFPAISYSDEMIRIYAASGLSEADARLDEDEISRVEVVETAKLQDLIVAGRIQDGKTVIAMALFRDKMERGEIPADFFA